jgi:hypothetical protein
VATWCVRWPWLWPTALGGTELSLVTDRVSPRRNCESVRVFRLECVVMVRRGLWFYAVFVLTFHGFYDLRMIGLGDLFGEVGCRVLL